MNAAPPAMRVILALLTMLAGITHGPAQAADRVVDIATRPGITQRFLLLEPPQARATVVLFAGGDGGLQLTSEGGIGALRGNFLVRSRQLFADQGLIVAVADAPSDRQNRPYLSGFRQTAEHVEDVRALMAWLRQKYGLPVWLAGTSRGTQSVAAIAVELTEAGAPDGIVLTSTILTDRASRPVPAMALQKIQAPVLVVHHEEDGCSLCSYAHIPDLMQKLQGSRRKALQTWRGGLNRGDPCEALGYHGFNGLDREVVAGIADWIK